MTANILKERKIINVSHQTVNNFLTRHGLNGNSFETAVDRKMKLRIYIGKSIDDSFTPVFILDKNRNPVDIRLLDEGKLSVFKSMLDQHWYHQALQSLDLYLYSLIDPHDFRATKGTPSQARKITKQFQKFIKDNKSSSLNKAIVAFLNK